MEEHRLGILPRLRSFCDNPVLLVEESHKFGENGSLYRKENKMLVETGLHASSYYGFLESIRMMGVDVVTVPATPDMLPTIWYLIAMDGYLSREHYPKHAKHFDVRQQALGALCCVPGIGEKRAVAALEHASIAGIANATKVEGLTEKQMEKVQKMLRYHQ
jgi:ERCC4-type nuclease